MLTFALVAALSGATPPAVVGGPATGCRRLGPRMVVERSTSPPPRKLDELPPAVAVLAVNKSVNGCPVSVLMQIGPDGKRVEQILEDSARKRPARSAGERGSDRHR